MSDILDSIDELDDIEDGDLDAEDTHPISIVTGVNDDDGDNYFNEDDDEEEGDLAAEMSSILDAEDTQASEMGQTEAQEITNAIKSAATVTYALLAKAHEGKAHQSLGYDSWGEYVKAEFEMSPQRSYQLLDLSKAVKMIEAAAPEGTHIKLTEAQARDLKRELPRITERIHEETTGKTPEESREIIDDIVREEREEKIQKRVEDKAHKSREQEMDEARDEGYRAGLESAADAILEADAERQAANEPDGGLMDVEVEGDINQAGRAEYMKLVQALVMNSNMGDPQDIVDAIPENNFDDIYDRVIDTAGLWNRIANYMDLRR